MKLAISLFLVAIFLTSCQKFDRRTGLIGMTGLVDTPTKREYYQTSDSVTCFNTSRLFAVSSG